jgi:hypothetical protein
MRLTYTGPSGPDTTLPLPEGWVAADHDEPDEAAAAAKLASGLYREAEARGRVTKTRPQEDADAGD